MKVCPLCDASYERGDRCPVDGAVLLDAALRPASHAGRVLNDIYRIEEEIASGGMGTVYRGVQVSLDRPVAIKLLAPHLHGSSSAVQRFLEEARRLSTLSHPNVVGVIDFGNTADGLMYMVMELLEGSTLEQVVAGSGKLDLDRAVKLMRQICAGVAVAHRNHVVHRDLKPSNLLVIGDPEEGTETVKVLDFGIARVLDDESTRLTSPGLLVGSPGFISPEQIAGEGEADERSDLYALGGILYFLLTGRKPYAGASSAAILARQLAAPPDPDLEPLRSRPALAAVVAKAMARRPDERYQSPSELLAALEGALAATPAVRDFRTGPAPGPHGRLWMTALLAFVVLVVGLVAWVTVGPSTALRELRHAESPAVSPTAEGARGVTPAAITFGMNASFSGGAGPIGRAMYTGLRTRFEEANAAGGIHGRRLEIVALDDGDDPARAVENTLELLEEREVFALVGQAGTPSTAMTAPLAVRARTTFFGALDGSGSLRKDPPEHHVFTFRPSYAQEAAGIVDYLTAGLGAAPEGIAVFAQHGPLGDEGYDGVVAALAEAGYEGEVPRVESHADAEAVARAVETLRRTPRPVEAVVIVAASDAASHAVRALRERLPSAHLAGFSAVDSDLLAAELQPSELAGLVVSQVVPPPWSDEPAVVRYREALERYSSGEPPGFVSLEGYLTASVLVDGLERAGPELSTERLIGALEGIGELDIGMGAAVFLSSASHQAGNRIWGVRADDAGRFRTVDLTPRDRYQHARTRRLVEFVEAAAALMERKGTAAFAEFSRSGSRWREAPTYLFVYDGAGVCVFHGRTPELVGENLLGLRDANGKRVIEEIVEVTRRPARDANDWIFYLWEEQTGLAPTWKASFVRKVVAPDGRVFVLGSGMHDFDGERAFVQRIVDRAAAALAANDREAVFEAMRSPGSPYHFLGSSVFVADREGHLLVDPSFPTIRGRDLSGFRDATGRPVIEEAIAKLARSNSAWVDYILRKPGESTPIRKHLYVRKVTTDGDMLLVGADL